MRTAVVTAMVLLVACTGTARPDAAPPVTGSAAQTTAQIATPTTEVSVASPSESCDPAGQPWTVSLTASAQPLLNQDGLEVEAVVYPHPDYEGKPWSQWGQGIVTSDGRFYSAIGDHLGQDGNSYLYEYDPSTNELALIADVRAVTGQVPGSWGYGKVHAQMVEGSCGIYVATYWGTRRGLAFDENYRGDHLLRLDPAARTVADLSVIAPDYGVPSLASSPDHGVIYAEAVDPFVQPNEGWFVVLDQGGQEIFRTDVPHVGFRAMAVDAQGRALFSAGNAELAVYDPEVNEVTTTITGLPGTWLRAASSPSPDGTIFGVTREPDALFALGPDGAVRDMGAVEGYTTSLALSPDGETLYYVPYAHGGSSQRGTPLVAVDTATGDQRHLVLLNEAAEETLGLTLGGSYDVAMSPTGDTLYIGMNAGLVGSGENFGSVVLLIVHLDR